jgi:adenine-specific DNA-methyltransferase
MTNPDKPSTDTQMNGQSLDIAEQRRKEFEQLFPGIFTETRDDKGELKVTIDLERLKAELGEFTDIYDSRRERYGMDWPGKRDCLRLIQQPSTATLKPCREESVDFDTTENNLEVLKLLQKSYYSKVKMIYIDPPYNTGKEFIYPDNFSESLDTYLQYAGLKDSEGRTFSTNTANEGRFHTKWLNMMYPRLYLARNLLREDGVIFISIDDNEVENLRRMCDEIFGEENFIATAIWQKVYAPKSSAKYFSEDHEYVVVYARQASSWVPELLPRTDEQDAAYKNPDNDPRGPWRPNNLAARNYYSKGTYPITCPSGRVISGPPSGSYWRISREKFDELNSDGRIWWGENGNNIPAPKIFLTEVKQGRVPQTLWTYKEVGHTQEAKRDLLSKLTFSGSDSVFDTPKPTRLIRRMVQIATEIDDEAIVLDFFSGAASTAAAVMDQNAEDGGNRKFVMVQLPEPTGAEDFKTIAEIGKERIRSAASSLRESMRERLDFNDESKIDLGFKVLKLNQSNFKLWQAPAKDVSDEELLQQMELNVDHIDPNASQEDLLYELLIKSGVMPTEKVEQIELAGHTLFSVAEGSLLVHLEDNIDQALIDAVLAKAPGQFICLDKAFHGNDQLKTNAVKTFEAFNQGKEKIDQIDFKTV